MKMTVIRDHFGDAGMAKSGSVIDVTDGRARELESKKLAVRAFPANLGKGGATKGAARPTPTPPAGGETGAEKPALLSPQVQAPRPPASKTRRAKRG